MFGVSHVPELIILVVIVLLIFGPGRLPGLGRGVGEMIRGFRQETTAAKREEEEKKAAKEEVASKA
jgi:sec-independent protein translocase protein TatA